jgi:hypothetical protein
MWIVPSPPKQLNGFKLKVAFSVLDKTWRGDFDFSEDLCSIIPASIA